jgi:hypothetical protein
MTATSRRSKKRRIAENSILPLLNKLMMKNLM